MEARCHHALGALELADYLVRVTAVAGDTHACALLVGELGHNGGDLPLVPLRLAERDKADLVAACQERPHCAYGEATIRPPRTGRWQKAPPLPAREMGPPRPFSSARTCVPGSQRGCPVRRPRWDSPRRDPPSSGRGRRGRRIRGRDRGRHRDRSRPGRDRSCPP